MEANQSVVYRLLDRVANRLGPHVARAINVFDNPTEELLHGAREAKPVKLYAKNFRGKLVRKGQPMKASGGGAGLARLEENYLFSSRRFPTAANNTISSGALVTGIYPFFSRGIGDDASAVGFPTSSTLTKELTNMELGGQIAQGTSFVFNQIGVSFNSDVATADVNPLLDICSLQFSKAGGQFTLNHGPLKFWPAGMGAAGYAAYGTTASTTTVRIEAAHNGNADIRSVRNLKIARVLKEKETFAYNVIIERVAAARDGVAVALTNFVVMTIWLWGGQRNLLVV